MVTRLQQQDPRNLPAYPVVDAAHYLTIPVGTLRSWLKGRSYPIQSGSRYFEPLIERPSPNLPQLSFTNLVEAHVLRIIRQQHQVPLDKVRTALDYLTQEMGVAHPLARVEFQTDGVDLFIASVGQLVNVSQSGQLAMRKALQSLLQRIEWDEDGLAAKLFPVTRFQTDEAPRVLIIDPRISFGRPVLVGTGVQTAILAERYKAGESVDALAEDYSCDRLQIEEAIRCELALITAA